MASNKRRPPKGNNGAPNVHGLNQKQQDQIEQEYGLSYALFQAFPELKNALNEAIAKHETPQQFTVKIAQTNWFKKHSDTWRQYTALKYTDPANYAQRMQKSQSAVRNLADSIGVDLAPSSLKTFAERALLLGWDDGQVRDVLSQYVKPSATGDYGGTLANSEQNLNQVGAQNGIRLSKPQMQGYMQALARGDGSEAEFINHIRNTAAATFDLYGDQIKGGMNLSDIASPYVQAMATTLEMNPADLNMFDPTIRSALSGTLDPATGKKTPTSVTDFETRLRQDKRWQYTDAAKTQARGYAAAIASAWGLQ